LAVIPSTASPPHDDLYEALTRHPCVITTSKSGSAATARHADHKLAESFQQRYQWISYQSIASRWSDRKTTSNLDRPSPVTWSP